MSVELQHQLKQMSKTAIALLIECAGLQRKYRIILTLRYVDELSIYEIGEKMGYTKESATNLLSKARKQLITITQKERHIFPDSLQRCLDEIKSEE